MENLEMINIIIAVVIIFLLLINTILVLRIKSRRSGDNTSEKMNILAREVSQLKSDLKNEQELMRNTVNHSVNESVGTLGKLITQNLRNSASFQRAQLQDMKTGMEKELVSLKTEVETKLGSIQEDNNTRLDQMREVVDEKLQRTLGERMTESFKVVNDSLEQVHKGLGEMQNLAQGVGDLKKVMSNVKTRGILGEIQLGAIIEEILSPNQYEKNVVTKRGSSGYVEYAVKLPSEDGTFAYLPIDSKFPGETYGALCDAYESGNPELIQEKRKKLLSTIRSEAKDIREKYIDPPNTTEFAIMFLPFEGLYAEVINNGYLEILQREYHVNIAGPSTMAALLNSLQMGFRTFAIQKRSGEVWQVLGAVRTEFEKFSSALAATQNRINQANDELEKLVGTRTRQMQRKLKEITELDEDEAKKILDE